MATTVFVPFPTAPAMTIQQWTTGFYWSNTGNVYKPPPTGAGTPFPVEFLMPVTRAGETSTYSTVVPDAAGDNWQVLVYSTQAPNVETPAAHATGLVVGSSNGGGPSPDPQLPEQEPVSAARTSKLTYSDTEGLVSERTRTIQMGFDGLFAVDFGADMRANQRIKTINSILRRSGQGQTNINALGVDRQQVKMLLNGYEEGDLMIGVNVSYGNGHTADANVYYRVVDNPLTA